MTHRVRLLCTFLSISLQFAWGIEFCCNEGALVVNENGTVECKRGNWPDSINAANEFISVDEKMARKEFTNKKLNRSAILCQDFVYDIGKKELKFLWVGADTLDLQHVDVTDKKRYPIRKCCQPKQYFNTKTKQCVTFENGKDYNLVDDFKQYFTSKPFNPQCKNFVDYTVKATDIYFAYNSLNFKMPSLRTMHRINLDDETNNYCIQRTSDKNDFFIIRLCEEDIDCSTTDCIRKCAVNTRLVEKSPFNNSLLEIYLMKFIEFFGAFHKKQQTYAMKFNTTNHSKILDYLVYSKDKGYASNLVCTSSHKKLTGSWIVTPTLKLQTQNNVTYDKDQFCLNIETKNNKHYISPKVCHNNGHMIKGLMTVILAASILNALLFNN